MTEPTGRFVPSTPESVSRGRFRIDKEPVAETHHLIMGIDHVR